MISMSTHFDSENAMSGQPTIATRTQRGFSIVELMVALVIGLIMVSGLIQIFIANRQSYRVMESAGFMQENLRFAVGRVAASARMAGHWGIPSVGLGQVTGRTTGSACTSAWARDINVAVWGVDGSPGVPSAVATCIPASSYQPNTDVIVVRYAGPDGVDTAATLAAGQWYLVSAAGGSGGVQGQLVLGNGLPLANPDQQTLVFQYNAEMFWVRRCSDPGPDNNCGTGDDGDGLNPIPTLMRSYLDYSGTWTSEPLAEGVEQFQLEYQIMNRQWMSATQVTALAAGRVPQWDRITGVRVAGLMRSAERDARLPPDTRSFNLSGDTPNYVAPANQAQYLRVAYEANALIRPRVRPAPAI